MLPVVPLDKVDVNQIGLRRAHDPMFSLRQYDLSNSDVYYAKITYQGRDGLSIGVPCLKLRHGEWERFQHYRFELQVHSPEVRQRLERIDARLQELAFEHRSHFGNSNNLYDVSRLSVFGYEDEASRKLAYETFPHQAYFGILSAVMRLPVLPPWMPNDIKRRHVRLSRFMERVVIHFPDVYCYSPFGFHTYPSFGDMVPAEEKKE